MIAFQDGRLNGTFARPHWLPNLASGLVVGVVALPLAMAFAIASGARPEQGIATAIIAAIVVSLFGGSRWQIAGPTGAFVVLLSSVTARHGIAGLQVATLMAGAMLVAMGLAKLGGILRYIPRPVILGFTAGIGVISSRSASCPRSSGCPRRSWARPSVSRCCRTCADWRT
jgi:SulP family sulfate permease